MSIVVFIAYAPLLLEFFRRLWDAPQYQHFPFVLGAFAWLLSQRVSSARPRAGGGSSRGMWMAPSLVLAALALLGVAQIAPSPWLAYFSLIVLVAALFVQASQVLAIDGLWAVWILLWLILPLPLNRDQALVTELQRLSSRASSLVLDAIGVPHLMDGNTLLMEDKQFFVDEACSGIISVMSILACAVIYGVWRRRSALHVVALVAAGIGWATVMNTLRISSIAVAQYFWQLDWSEGTPHEILSLVVFAIAFLALLSTDVLLEGMLAPVGQVWDRQFSQPIRFGAALVRLWDWAVAVPRAAATDADAPPGHPGHPAGAARPWAAFRPPLLTLAFAMIVGLHLLPRESDASASASSSTLVQACIERALATKADDLPANIHDLQRDRFLPQERERNDVFGQFSRAFEYRDRPGNVFLVSFDFPYPSGWHELTVCYRGIGWTLGERRVGSTEAAHDGSTWQHMEADLSKPDGSRAFLAACAFNEAGQPIELPTLSFWEDTWLALTGNRRGRQSGAAFQTQVLIARPGAISDGERDMARELLYSARTRYREMLAEGGLAEKRGEDHPATDNSAPEAAVETTAEPQTSIGERP